MELCEFMSIHTLCVNHYLFTDGTILVFGTRETKLINIQTMSLNSLPLQLFI